MNRMESHVDVGSYTTMPRKRRDRLPSAKELQEMSLERRLATLNISQNRVPVPPPRVRRFTKIHSVPDQMASSTAKSTELYGEKSHSFDGEPRYISGDNYQNNRYRDCNEYQTSSPHQSYHKYEVPRKEYLKNGDQNQQTDTAPMCDIIQSSQQTLQKSMLRRPDILRGSFSADIQSMLADSSQADSQQGSQMKSRSHQPQRAGHFDDNKNLVYAAGRVRNDTDKQTSSSRHDSRSNGSTHNRSKKASKSSTSSPVPKSSSTPTKDKTNSNNRFMFYRPKIDKMTKQHSSAIGLVGMAEVNYSGGSLIPSPEGSFVNPAFEIVDAPTSEASPAPAPVKAVPTPSKSVYSTMGSSFSTRPCTPSPPSHRFRNQKPPLPTSPEPKISPIKPLGPTPLKPMLSAKHLETSLKHYSSQNKLNTTGQCSPQALDSMMKYYNMKDSDEQSNSPTPPPAKLTSSKKNTSPYSSTGSLNVSGDSIDVVLRRKKKIKIRPLSFSSDDESVKRVSLEINLAPNNSNDKISDTSFRDPQEDSKRKSLSMSQSSLNQGTVEKLDLHDLTSTETAKLLKKQFAKLKVKASNLKVKDTELKQRFALLQNQRGRVCGHSGGVTKSKIRSSPILL